MTTSKPVQNIARGSTRAGRAVGPVLWPGEWKEALARWVVLALIGSIGITALALHTWLMWIATPGVLLALHQAGRTGQPEDDAEDQEDDDQEAEVPEPLTNEEFLDLLHKANSAGRGVLLATLRTFLEEYEPGISWEIADVRVLCDAAGVPMRQSVRVPGVGVSVGVHRDDIPPAPPAPSERGPVAGSSAGQGTTPTTTRRYDGAQITITDPASSHLRRELPRAR